MSKNPLEAKVSTTVQPVLSDYDKLAEEYISLLYHGASGFISYRPGERELAEKNKVFLTYGEILFPSFKKILDYMDITENDVFYDFGAGIGKACLQVLLTTPIKKIIGIEANKKRSDQAIKMYKKVKEEFPEIVQPDRQFECLHKNILEVDVTDATIIYTCSTLFAPTLLADIGKIVDKCPNLKYLVSIPSVKYDFAKVPCKFGIERIIDIDCTWDKTRCYVYTANGDGPVYNPFIPASPEYNWP